MGEAHDPVADVDDLGALGGGQGVVAGYGGHDLQRRLGHRGRDREAASRNGRQAVQTGADQHIERHRQPLARLQVQRSGLHRAPELEREERISARQLVHVVEHWTGGHPIEPTLQQALDGAEAQRPQFEALETIACREAIEAERHGRRTRCALGDQEPDRFVPETPRGEGEHRGSWPVEPLHVVDGDHDRRRAREATERGQRGQRDGLLVGRLAALGHQEDDLERLLLRARQIRQQLRLGAEQISECRIGEARLRLCRARHQRSQPRRLRAAQC